VSVQKGSIIFTKKLVKLAQSSAKHANMKLHFVYHVPQIVLNLRIVSARKVIIYIIQLKRFLLI
jgi:hypothetical protein